MGERGDERLILALVSQEFFFKNVTIKEHRKVLGVNMAFYVQQDRNRRKCGVWEITESVAKRIDVSNPEDLRATYFNAEQGETIWQAIARQTPWFSDSDTPFKELANVPGCYYPRIARPMYASLDTMISPSWGVSQETAIIARGQITALMSDLDRICRTVHPAGDNLKTYGHDIRNLLLLACTEVEAQWRGVLVANGIEKKSFSSKDYIQLSPAMKLPEYVVSFSNYPWIESIRPFEGWATETAAPTKSLGWYEAYNAVKHNREAEFAKGTLENVFQAVSACVVMLAAQYGFINGLFSELSSCCRLSERPKWSMEDVYIILDQGWTPINYKFEVA
jgi:hypothetical protein